MKEENRDDIKGKKSKKNVQAMMDEMENKLMAVTGGKKPKLSAADEERFAKMKK